jgi:hypothetical protein
MGDDQGSRCSLPSKSPKIKRHKQENDAMLSPFSSIRRRKPLKIVCEAPAYEIVQASEVVGMRAPEDVRWRRQSMPKGETVKRKSLLRRLWRLFFAFDVPDVVEACSCGSLLPDRRSVLLRRRSGQTIRYALAQCGRCQTIVWDEEHTSEEPNPAGQLGNV